MLPADHSVAGPFGPPEGRSLENPANNLSRGPLDRADRRRSRFATRAVSWRVSSLQRVAFCGRFPRSTSTGVTVRRSADAVAGFSGLQHCASVWSCAVCSSSILVQRAIEIGAVLSQGVVEGHALGFGTFTMRHRRGEPLRALWGAAGAAWQRVISGRGWMAVQGAHGVVGWVRVWEVTDGANGWHVHVHFVVVLAPGSTSADLDVAAAGMFKRWSAGLVSAGRDAPLLVGQDWHMATGDEASADLAGYLFKLADAGSVRPVPASLGLELTHSQPGRSRSDLATRPAWGLLDDFASTGDLAALDRWHEWEKGSKGRRQVGWSKGLRARFAPDLASLSDEGLVEREMGSAEDDLVVISLAGWARLVSMPWEMAGVLEETETGGLPALRARLVELGVDHSVVA